MGRSVLAGPPEGSLSPDSRPRTRASPARVRGRGGTSPDQPCRTGMVVVPDFALGTGTVIVSTPSL